MIAGFSVNHGGQYPNPNQHFSVLVAPKERKIIEQSTNNNDSEMPFIRHR